MWVSNICRNISNVVLNQLTHLMSNWIGSGNAPTLWEGFYMPGEVGSPIYPIFQILPEACPYSYKRFALGCICYWGCLFWVLLPKCFYHFSEQDSEKSVVLPVLKILMAEETNLALSCFDTTADFCFWVVLFLLCDKSAQILPVFKLLGKKMQFVLVGWGLLFSQGSFQEFSFLWSYSSCSGDWEGTVPLAWLTASRTPTQGRSVFHWCCELGCFSVREQRPLKGRR